MTGFKTDASFRSSSGDVVKPVCEISPLGTFERRCLTPRCSRNLRQAKYTEREQGRSRLSLYNKPECFYDDDGNVVLWGETSPHGESTDALIADLEQMLADAKRSRDDIFDIPADKQ
jgi:hypothetical protein